MDNRFFQSPKEGVPLDIWYRIAAQLSFSDVNRFANVCHDFHKMVEDANWENGRMMPVSADQMKKIKKELSDIYGKYTQHKKKYQEGRRIKDNDSAHLITFF